MECEHCKNKFSTKPNLVHHQKTAKYCLKLRGSNLTKKYQCNLCNKEYTSNFRLSTHKKKCVILSTELMQLRDENKELKIVNDMLESQLADQKQTIKELQDKLGNVAIRAASRATTSNKTQINNFIQNMQPVTEEHLIDNVQHLTIDHIIKGPEGYAEFALEYPLKDRMVCSDYARRKIKFKDKDGNIVIDPEMTTLARKFFNSIKEKNKELICMYANELKERLGDENVMDTVVKIFDYKAAIDQGSDGEKNEFHHDFVKQVCSQITKE